ncbi:MAG: hypothetical protein LAN18_02090 [Acidobacteriia bacterium]|nr:hypothetical protein [Terriglobia bacterium]
MTLVLNESDVRALLIMPLPLEAMSNTMIVNSNGGTATLSSVSMVSELPGQTEILALYNVSLT